MAVLGVCDMVDHECKNVDWLVRLSEACAKMDSLITNHMTDVQRQLDNLNKEQEVYQSEITYQIKNLRDWLIKIAVAVATISGATGAGIGIEKLIS